MRKILMTLGAVLVIGIVVVNAKTNPPNTETATQPQIEVPTYAKWSKIAMKETQKKYPDAKIIDYLHEGSVTNGDKTIEKFKLWLKESNKEFGVLVRVKYITKTEELVSIEFEETSK